MRTIIAAAALALIAASSSGCFIVVDDDDSSLTIANESSFVFTEIRVAFAGDRFGANLVPGDLFPGESVSVSLDCDVYDVQIVDDTNTVCELLDLSLCFEDAIWVVDDFELDSCSF